MNSYKAIREWILDKPERVQFLPSEQLVLQLEYWQDELDSEIKTHVLGEALFRCWLEEERLLPELWDITEKILQEFFFIPRNREQLSESLKSLEGTVNEHSLKKALWYVNERIKSFEMAHGIIPVLHKRFPTSPAIPVPFQLDPGEERRGVVRDRYGRILDGWSSVVCCQNQHLDLPSLRVTLWAFVEGECVGHSLGLPISLAWKMRSGQLPAVSPLCLLATGGLTSDGRVIAVDGVVEKAAMAKQIGSFVFVHPEEKNKSIIDHGVSFIPETPFDRVLEKLKGHPIFQNLKSPLQYRQDLESLSYEISSGCLNLCDAERRRQNIHECLEQNPESEERDEALLHSTLLAGSIANHQGKADVAAVLNEEALQKSEDAGSYDLYLDAAAAEVVSLCDLGLLETANKKAQSFLNWATDLRAPVGVRRKAKMKAHGVLGGQVLLHIGLGDETVREASLIHLKKALDEAKVLEDAYQIAFDKCQIYLWHALFTPEKALVEYDGYRNELHRAGGTARVSLEFIKAYRLQAATRTTQSVDWSEFALPSESIGWLKACAHKYRGMLYSRAGMSAEAYFEYQECIVLLAKESSPVLRFMYATSLLQAGEDLFSFQQKKAREFLTIAIEVFRSVQLSLYGLYQEKDWIKRAEGLLELNSVYELPNPAILYRY